ncbi:ATP-binding cassette domain-containing protein [Donghicola sp. C2-DW-16]|uniref:ATP-binding cassette domain-containing protein n=1 Tax=Donghicola mangrovi TaxID=2729614 RepID=A0ABX2PCI6_9RHOB|nr:ATP-binding cassette domain-containing protein [Donghicola mangrovi]NVO27180.1 ATP-binding cassette domain-containing protein [Donghicola mangrovi]
MSKAPIALTVKPGGKDAGKAKAVLPPDVTPPKKSANPILGIAQIATKWATKPKADPEGRAKARAELASVYAGYLGLNVPPRDVLDAMMRAGGADATQPKALAAGLQAAGLHTKIMTVGALTPAHWPAIAQMVSGQSILVLDQIGSEVVIYDTSCIDNRAYVPLTEFEPFFAGVLIRAEVTVEQIKKIHTPEQDASHWFWGEFPKFKRQIGEIALGSLIANILAVSVALFSLQVYDRVIPHQSEATLWVLAIGALVALGLEAMMKLARARLMDSAGRQIELNIQRMLMEKLLGMRSDRRGVSSSQLFGAMREFGAVREFFTAASIGSLADLPFILVFLLLVASIAGSVVWVLILGGVLMVIPGFFLQKKMIRLTRESQGASTRSARLLHETIFELDTVKTQRGEDRIRRLWGELTGLSSIKSSEQRRMATALTYWSQGIQQATYIAAVVTGTYLVFVGEFTVGSIIAVGILTSRTLAPLTQLAGTLARWSNVRGALDALDAIAEAEQDLAEGRTYLRRDKLEGRFEFRNVQFKYDRDGAPILDIRALAIGKGESVAVLGVNGSGKSTFLKLLSGLYAPTEGRIMIDGVDMGQIAPRDLRRNIGYLGQDVRLFAGTLRENLNLHQLERDDERLFEALDFAGLGPFVKGHHKGLDLEITDGGQGLSVGQRQSIGWARIWLQNPPIVLLDEPTASLDQTLEATLVSRLESWLQGRTTIVATHRLPILSLTKRTLIFQNGRMAVDGPREEVVAHLTANAAGKITR